jgi:hypothetical protein
MTKARTLADNFAADINGITAGTGITGGGTSGTVTVTNEMATIIDAKGDLVAGTGADTFARLAVGTNGDTLVADSSTSTGLRYQGNFAAGKNKIYNASMLIAQRGTSFTGISGTDAVYTVDRWSVLPQNLGTVTATQDTTVPTGAGVAQSLKLACTTADASPAALTRLRIIHRLEGFDVQDLDYGTASAKPLTLSFWVRSSKTGTYIVEFWTRQPSPEKHISTTYTIITANTWQQVKITIPGDTATNIANDNGSRFDVYFYLAAGSDYTSGTLATSWAEPVTANRAVGQVNWADSATATFYITAVQLEIGSVATAFQTMTGTIQGELAAAQRYFWRANAASTHPKAVTPAGSYYSTTAFYTGIPLPSEMRTAPSLTAGTVASFSVYSNGTGSACTAIALGNATPNMALLNCTTAAKTAGHAGWLETAASTNAYLDFSAEL